MKRTILICTLAAGSVSAADHNFAQPCADIFPRAVAAMTSQRFEPTLSDSAGGVLVLRYAGEPLAWAFRVGHADELLAKYAQGGEKMRKKFRGMSFGKATATFRSAEGGCHVELNIDVLALDTKADTSTAAKWVRVEKQLPSSGAAEAEAFARMEAK